MTSAFGVQGKPARSLGEPDALQFREQVAGWLAEVRSPDWNPAARAGISYEQSIEERRAWDASVSESGLSGISWPIEEGGLGLGLMEEFIFSEEAAAAGAPDVLNFIGIDLAGPAIITHGTQSQKERYLKPILEGETLWCEGFSEPNAGSDMAAISTAARRDDDGWRVNGQKVWTSVADIADRCYLLVQTDPDAPRRKNLSVLLLDMHQPGVEVRPIRQATGGSEYSEVFFNDAWVDGDDLLGEENQGWSLGNLGGFRQTRLVRDAMRRYVLIRAAMDSLSAFARPGDVDHLEREVRMLRAHVVRTAELMTNGRDASAATSVMRLLWAELWQRIALEGVKRAPLAQKDYWREQYINTRGVTIAGGASQIQRNVISMSVLGLPR